MANGIPAVRRIQKFRNGGDYSFLDRALDTPLGPGSPNTLRDVPAMARSLGPGFLELARYQPTGVGDVAEAAHFASSLRDPEYRGELVDLSKVSTDPFSLPFKFSDLNAPQWDAIAAGLPGGAAVSKGIMSMVPMSGVTAWHGSPHRFERFRTSQIGTGEGAQAYGHGLYFAQNPKTGKWYRKRMSPHVGLDPVINVGNRTIAWRQLPEGSDEKRAMNNLIIEGTTRTPKQTLDALEQTTGEFAATDHAAARVIRKWMDEGDVSINTGYLYEVDIPDEAVSRMLDWDKPLIEQSEDIQKFFSDAGLHDLEGQIKLTRVNDELAEIEGTRSAGVGLIEHMGLESRANELAVERRNLMANLEQEGSAAYSRLARKEGGYPPHDVRRDPAAASAALNVAGIPGIKYYDGPSRAAQEGTSNFVVFDENLPKIISGPEVQKRDGGPIMSPMPRGITGASRPTGLGPMHVPRGTVYMQEGGDPFTPLEIPNDRIPEEPYYLSDIPKGLMNLADMAFNSPKVRDTLGVFSKEDQDWAESLQDLFPEEERYGGRGDVARHLAAGWLASKARNPRFSKGIMQIREQFDTAPYARQDTINNSIGYKIEAGTKEEAERVIQRIIAQGNYARVNSPSDPNNPDQYQDGGGVHPQQGGGMFLDPGVSVPAFNASDYLSPAAPAPVQPAPTNFSPYGSVYTPDVVAPTYAPTPTTAPAPTPTPTDTTMAQSYAEAPVSTPVPFTSIGPMTPDGYMGGTTTGNYLGGTAAELAPDTYFAPNIPGAGQGYTSQFSDPDAMQNLDYSNYPKRGDFGSSDDGGHLEFKQAENEWWQNKANPTVAPPTVAPPTVAPPTVAAPNMMPPTLSEMIQPPVAPSRSDYGEEEGMDYRNDLNAYRSVAPPPQAVAPPPVMAPMPPPPPVMQPEIQPIRSDYGAEEGMDYRNDLNAYRSLVPPPVMQPPTAPLASEMPTREALLEANKRKAERFASGENAQIPIGPPRGIISEEAANFGVQADKQAPMPPMMQPTAPPPPVIPSMPPTPQAMQQPMPKRSDYGEEEGMDYRNDLNDYRSPAPPPPTLSEMIQPPVMQPPPPQAVAPPTMPTPQVMQPPLPPNHPSLGGQLTPVQQPPQQVMPPQIRNPAPDLGGQLTPVQQPPQPQPQPQPQQVMPPQPQFQPPIPQPMPAPPLPDLGPRPSRSEYGQEEGMDYKNDLREWNEAKTARGYQDGGGVQYFQQGKGVEIAPSSEGRLTSEQRAGLRQFFSDPSTAPAEEPGFIAEEGFWNLHNRPGFDMRDLTDVVFNPSSKLDKALLPLMLFPPAAAAATLAKWGYGGYKAVRAMKRLGELQRNIPGVALGNPRNTRGITTPLGDANSGRRTYMQANVASEPAEMVHGRYLLDRNQDSKELEDFLTPPSGGR